MAAIRRSPFEEQQDEFDDFQSSVFQSPTAPQAPNTSRLSSQPYQPTSEPTFGVPRVPQTGGSGLPDLASRDGGQTYDDWTSSALRPTSKPAVPTRQAPQAQQQTSAPTDFAAKYSQQTTALQGEQNPQRRAMLEDQLARQVSADLKAAGHDVTWKGSQLMVDGRAYSVGSAGASDRGQPTYQQEGAAGGVAGPPGSQGALQTGAGTAQGQTPPYAPSTGANGVPAGWDADKVARGHNSPKYAAMDDLQSLSQQLQQIPDEASRKAFAQQFITSMIPKLEAAGATVLEVRGEKARIDAHDGKGPLWIDMIQDIDGAARAQWIEPGGADVPQAMSAPAPGAPAAPGGDGGVGVGGDTRPSWMTAPGYEPGEITNEGIPDFSYQHLLDQMGGYTPTDISGRDFESTDVGAENLDWSGGGIESSTEELIRRMLANPESLDARTIEMMKSRSRDEAAAMYASEDEDLRGMAYRDNLSDSPWYRSQRLQGARDRDATIINKNRDIEIGAATQNAADRRAAAQMGSDYTQSKAQRTLARAEYLTGLKGDNANRQLEAAKIRMQADIAQNQNLFNAAKLRQDGVLGAVDADLKKAAAVQDRLSLREQVKQAAAELGLSRDKLMTDWLIAMQDDATKRFGIQSGMQIDREKLAQMTQSQREDLAFRYAQLGEQARGTNLNYGLDAARLQQQNDQWSTDTQLRTLGL